MMPRCREVGRGRSFASSGTSPTRPPVVWRALTEPDELKRWFPHDITTDEWKVGATLTFTDREAQGAGDDRRRPRARRTARPRVHVG